jgi:hypothetical protein
MKMKTRFLLALWVFGAFVTGPASAALPAAVDTAITNIGTDASSLFDKLWTPIFIVIGGMMLIRIVKRFLPKAV